MKRLLMTAGAAIVLASASADLSGCIGVPLSTAWHFRNFGPRNFVQTDPTLVRIALRTWSGMDLNGGAPELHVTLQFTGEQPQQFEMTTSRLTDQAATAGMSNPGAGREWYVFALDPAGVKTFRSMQQVLKDHMDASGKLKQHASVNMLISTEKMQMSPAVKGRVQKSKTVPVQLRLELSPEEGYYTLYEGSVPVKPQASAAASGGTEAAPD